MPSATAWAAALFAATLLACSGAPPDDGSDYELTSSPHAATPESASDAAAGTPAPPADAGAEPAPSPAPPPAPPSAFTGKSAATSAASYGGGSYCKYQVTLKNVAISMTVLASGALDKMTVEDVAVESAIACPYAPSPPNNQVFTSTSSTASVGTLHVELTGGPGNAPKTSLVVDLVAKGDAYDATLTWKRTDQPAPLAWTVTLATSLAPSK